MANIITTVNPTTDEYKMILNIIEKLECGYDGTYPDGSKRKVIGIACLESIDGFELPGPCYDPYLSVRHIEIHSDGSMCGGMINPTFDYLVNTPYLTLAKYTNCLNITKCNEITYYSQTSLIELEYNGHTIGLSLVHKSGK